MKKGSSCSWVYRRSWLRKIALGLGPVETKRVGEVGLVQEAILRRGRHRNSGPSAKNDRLAHLMVPITEAQRLALGGLELEFRREHVGLDLLRRGFIGFHDRFGDGSHTKPASVVPFGW